MKIKDILVENEGGNQAILPVPLYHGSRKASDGDTITFQFRKKSSDTFPIIHKLINKFAVDKFNIPIRSCLFVSTSKTVASEFGTAVKVTPLTNNIRLFQHPHISDLTTDLDIDSGTITSNFTTILYANLDDIKISRDWCYNDLLDILDDCIHDSSDIHEYKTNVSSMIRSDLSDYDDSIINEVINLVVEGIDSMNITKTAKTYVDKVVELELPDDLKTASENEIMMYIDGTFKVENT